MSEEGVKVNRLSGDRQHGSHGIGKPHGNLLAPAPARKLLHARFSLLVDQRGWRLVAGGGTLRQHEQCFAQAAAEFVSGFVPEIGGDTRAGADLRRAGHVHHHAGQLGVGVPRIQQVDRMVFVACAAFMIVNAVAALAIPGIA